MTPYYAPDVCSLHTQVYMTVDVNLLWTATQMT